MAHDIERPMFSGAQREEADNLCYRFRQRAVALEEEAQQARMAADDWARVARGDVDGLVLSTGDQRMLYDGLASKAVSDVGWAGRESATLRACARLAYSLAKGHLYIVRRPHEIPEEEVERILTAWLGHPADDAMKGRFHEET